MKLILEVCLMWVVIFLLVAYALMLAGIVYTFQWIDYPMRTLFWRYVGYGNPPKPHFPPECARILG